MTHTNSAFRAPQQSVQPTPPSPADLEEAQAITKASNATERDVGSALLTVTMIGMVASFFAAGALGWYLSGGEIVVAAKCVLSAVAIDILLFVWLRMAKRLRKLGGVTPSGKVLDAAGVIMTYYISGLGGFAVLITPRSDTAWALVGVIYLFIPTVMLLSYIAMPTAQAALREAAAKAQAKVEQARQAAANADFDRQQVAEKAEREVTISNNKRLEAEAYARVKPAELEAEQRKREAEQCDRDRKAAEREQVRQHGITLTGYLLLARRLQAAALAAKHAGMAPQQNHSPAPRNAAPGGRTRSAPALHQVPAPGVAPASAPGLHQGPAPGAPGAAPGAHQVRPPAPHQPPVSGGNGQVRPDIAWLADLAEPWREANPGAGRIRLVQELVRLVDKAGAEAGADLVRPPGAAPGARITDDVGKKVLAELGRRRKQREIEHLESLLSE